LRASVHSSIIVSRGIVSKIVNLKDFHNLKVEFNLWNGFANYFQ